MPYPTQEDPEAEQVDDFARQPIRMLGGVNLLQDPRTIRDDEVVLSQNAYPVVPGIMAKRGGLAWVSSPTFSDYFTNPTINLIPIAAATPTFLCSYDVLSVWYDPIADNLVAPTLTVVAFDLNGTANISILIAKTIKNTLQAAVAGVSPVLVRPWIFSFGTIQFVLFGSNVHPFPGVTVGQAPTVPLVGGYCATTNNTSIQPLQFNALNNIYPTVACGYRSRVIWANLGPGFERYILFSDNFNPTQVTVNNGDNALAINGRALQIGRDGDIIVGVVEIMLTEIGGPPASAALILCQNSAYLVTGEPNQTTDNQALTPIIGSLQVAQVSYNCGCASPWTIARTPYGIIWAGNDDVWMFQVGQAPLRVGTKIRPALLRNPPTMRYKMTAAYANGIYRLMCAGDGQSPQDSDPLLDQWYLDLRDGPPRGVIGEDEPAQTARWFGPMRFTTDSSSIGFIQGTRLFFQETRPGKDINTLYGLERGPLLLFTAFAIVAYDSNNDHDLVFSPVDANQYQIYDVPIPNVGGVSFQVEIRTKRYSLSTPRLQKLIDSVEMAIGVSETMQLAVDIILDDGVVITTTLANLMSIGMRLGVDKTDTVALADASQSIVLRDNNRDNGYTLQLRIYDNSGISINTDAFQFAFVYGGILTIATITQQLYSSIVTLCDAIVAAMNTATAPNTFTHNQGTNPRNAYPSITSNSATWFPDFTGVKATAAQAQTTRKLGAILGFATNRNAAAALTQTAESNVTAGTAAPPWATVNPLFTIDDIIVRYLVIPRRPT